ncbi:Uncharacterised protein [Vibrio cholerae]|uniref:Uncharacterized protein n=1 Tax=Vibrio cholerae TaxID=666 RepID=A0A656AU83_VIBCL|nr:Uncharacterised protein [Vibrio cholerae]CSD03792.1 Uncharacterised protein [Vibrio cholerae]CSD37109.1 Uncharacterised protein [Vibrio cholerae]
MEAVVHQAFGNIFFANPSFFFQRTDIDDALVRHSTICTTVKDRVVRTQTLHHIVGIQNRQLGGFSQTVCTHHRNVGPRDRQNGRAAKIGCGNREIRTLYATFNVSWQERC